MARKKGVRIAVIVEDQRLDSFVCSVLRGLGYHNREIRVLPGYPKIGHGSGKAWVNRALPAEVKTYRRAPHQRLAIVVATDADEQSVAQRTQALLSCFPGNGQQARQSDERIAFLIPKWSIETWGLALTGHTVTEDRSLKNDPRCQHFNWQQASDCYVDTYHAGEWAEALPSLRSAFDETRRIDN